MELKDAGGGASSYVDTPWNPFNGIESDALAEQLKGEGKEWNPFNGIESLRAPVALGAPWIFFENPFNGIERKLLPIFIAASLLI